MWFMWMICVWVKFSIQCKDQKSWQLHVDIYINIPTLLLSPTNEITLVDVAVMIRAAEADAVLIASAHTIHNSPMHVYFILYHGHCHPLSSMDFCVKYQQGHHKKAADVMQQLVTLVSCYVSYHYSHVVITRIVWATTGCLVVQWLDRWNMTSSSIVSFNPFIPRYGHSRSKGWSFLFEVW